MNEKAHELALGNGRIEKRREANRFAVGPGFAAAHAHLDAEAAAEHGGNDRKRLEYGSVVLPHGGSPWVEKARG